MRRTTVGFIVFTLASVCMAALCAACTARGQEALAGGEENWYREQETRLTADVRNYLDGEGFRDSGVSLTRIVEPEGKRSYTFTIHHGRIDRMGESGRQNLKAELSALTEDFVCAVPGEVCEFAYEFLIVEQDPQSVRF